MKTSVLIKAGMGLALLGAVSLAEAKPAEGEQGKGDKQGHQRPSREQILEKYDADGNGELSESERAALKADREQMQGDQKSGKRGGPSGERPSREEMIKKFDADGDGQLNEAERTAAREAMQKKGKGKGNNNAE